jgi:hypothetical protein
MNSTFKLFGLIALLAVIGFSFVSCDAGGGSKQGTVIIQNSSTYQEEIITMLDWSIGRGEDAQFLAISVPVNNRHTLKLDEGTYFIGISTNWKDVDGIDVRINAGSTVTLIFNGYNLYQSY